MSHTNSSDQSLWMKVLLKEIQKQSKVQGTLITITDIQGNAAFEKVAKEMVKSCRSRRKSS